MHTNAQFPFVAALTGIHTEAVSVCLKAQLKLYLLLEAFPEAKDTF